ncbi:MFS general substrate transporter [Rhizopogon vinicolor AM-OR11-026]|uniref:MFS general substrate transporter n=1 Tax=Rhizopogon vinicolor AM-OR11-026 TaxID=1314800 RepID=A0A1B7MG66_9AGAM|nr:MFS general substrate transporter [Rhizopogon vinicolor AM-OR11-026]
MSSSVAPSDGTNVNERTPLLDAGQQGQKKPTPLLKLQISILLLALLIEPISSRYIYPYVNQLVSELDITGGDKRKVGYYAGLIESLFFATQALTVLYWSRTSDRIGRKPVLLIGIFGLSLSMLCFGLSKTFWGLALSRCINGAFNSNIRVMKSIMMGELTDSTNIAQGFALMPMAWSIGATLGPVIGGTLEHPKDHFPNVFRGEFWSQFPYFLPSAVAAAIAIICFLAILLFLNETLPRKRTQEKPTAPADEALDAPENAVEDAPVPMRSLFVPSILIPVANYACLAILDIAMFALQPLFYYTPIERGGLGFDPVIIGFWMGSFGIVNGVLQTIIFAPLVHKYGPKSAFQFSTACSIPIFSLPPITNIIARQYGINWLVYSSLTLSLILTVLMDMGFVSILIHITAAAPNKRSLGATNGLAQTAASIVRAFGPAASTSMFAYSLQHKLLGGYAVYVVLVTMSVFSLMLSVKLPESAEKKGVICGTIP